MSYFTLPADYVALARGIEATGFPVTMPDGSIQRVRNLLTDEKHNVKLAKSGKARLGYYTVGLSLAPYTLAGVGNLCAHASPLCAAACLNTAGRGDLNSVQRARIAKTRLAFGQHAQREAFISLLVYQLERAERKAARTGRKLCVRLNVLSDLPWENLAPWLFNRFRDVQFYDYTKVAARLGHTPANYDLTFSRSERNETTVRDVLASGFRVAVVFNHRAPMPETYQGAPVIDGDATDLRFMDSPGVVVGLKAKGHARNTADGFVVY
jgi:hypothetical protein